MKRLLFITHRLPFPPDKGERVRAFHEIVALSRHFAVTVASPLHRPGEAAHAAALRQHCADVLTAPAGRGKWLAGALKYLQGGCNTEGHFNVPALRDKLLAAAAAEPFDVVVAYSSAVIPTALAVPARAHVADLVDTDSAKWHAYASAAGLLGRRFYRREADGVARLERQAVERCAAVLVVSEAEAATLPLRNDKVLVMANGVDLDYFAPAAAPQGPPSLVFTGSMDYLPNVQAVTWFAQHVWPSLLGHVPGLRLLIVGRDPTPAVRRLRQHKGIVVTGPVDDVRPYVHRAAVVIAPLQIAPGISNKVLEAMAMGKCILASPAALVGLDVQVGRDLMEASTPQEWQASLLSLLADEARRDQLGQAARSLAQREYTWPARLAPLVELCVRLGR